MLRLSGPRANERPELRDARVAAEHAHDRKDEASGGICADTQPLPQQGQCETIGRIWACARAQHRCTRVGRGETTLSEDVEQNRNLRFADFAVAEIERRECLGVDPRRHLGSARSIEPGHVDGTFV